MKYVLGRPLFAVLVAVLLAGGVILSVFTPDIFVFKQGANFTVQIMLGYLVLGMLLFILNKEFLMYISLACCVGLCMHLKEASNQHIRLPHPTDAPQIKCALINLSLSENFHGTMDAIRKSEADIIAFQEFTPDWDDVLNEEFAQSYPFRSIMTRIDPFGMAWFSKYPILLADTFAAAGIPNLLTTIELNQSTLVSLINVHTRVPADSRAYQDIKAHLYGVSEYIESLDSPILVAGDLNLPSWTTEVMQFKIGSRLSDSRRDIVPASTRGTVSFLKVPVDHIFYTADLECTAFRMITGPGDNHLGVIGTYQIVKDEMQRRELRVKQ